MYVWLCDKNSRVLIFKCMYKQLVDPAWIHFCNTYYGLMKQKLLSK